MRMRQKGFTLIELMIVVAIIGILAAVAVPAYSDYTVRAKVTEAITAAGAAKTSVADYYYATGNLPTSNDEAGLATGTDYAADVISAVFVGIEGGDSASDGAITVSFKESNGITAGNVLRFNPTVTGNTLAWDCTIPTTNGLPAQYAPASCRSDSTAD